MKLFDRVQQVGKCIDHANNAIQQSLIQQCWVKLEEKKSILKISPGEREKSPPPQSLLVNLCYSTFTCTMKCFPSMFSWV